MMKFCLSVLPLVYCMDIGSTDAFEIDEDKWMLVNRLILEGKSDFYDPTVFGEYLRGAVTVCPDTAAIYKSGNLSEFTEKVIVETARGNDSICLLKSQKVLTFIDAPPEPLKVNLEAMNWEGLGSKQLSIILGICKNLNLDCSSKLDNLHSPIDVAKVLIYRGKSLPVPPNKQEYDRSTMTLRTLAVTLGDGTITGELDLAGKSLEGANMGFLANHLISIFTDIQRKYLQPEQDGFSQVIDKAILEAMIRKLKQAVHFQSLLQKLAPLPGGYDVFENAMIDRIRQMEIDDDALMMAQITDHAITLSIKKTGPRLVEVLLFNSGFGLEHHTTVEIGAREKHYPARRYVDIPLGILKSLGVIKKVAELSAIVSKYAPAIDKRLEANYTPEDLYQCALSPLNDYIYQFKSEDIRNFRVIPSQRSGTCAFKCYWAYFAFNLGDSFRPLKLLTTKEIIERATAMAWKEQEKPVAHRLIKFGLENYARSVLRYRKRELRGKKLDIKLFGGRKFWRVYQKVRFQMGVKKPRSFHGQQFETHRWHRHLISLKNYSSVVQFQNFEEMESKIELPSSETDVLHKIPVEAPKDLDELMSQIDSILHNVCSLVWNLTSNSEKLVLITSYINEILPTPSHDVDFWDSVFLGNVSDEPVLKKLFGLLIKMLNFLKVENCVHPSTYVAILKMAGIYHKAMVVVEPKFAECVPFTRFIATEEFESKINDSHHEPGTKSSWHGIFSTQHKFISMPVFQEYEKIIQYLTNKNSTGPICTDENFFPKSVFGTYLDRYVAAVKWDQLKDVLANTHEEKLKNLSAQRLDESVLPHHYFWRDAIQYCMTVEKFRIVPSSKAISLDYDPYTACKVDGTTLHCKSSEFSPCYYTGNYNTTKMSYQPSMFSGIPGAAVPPFKYLRSDFSSYSKAIKKDMDFCDKDMPLFLNNTFGILGGFERLSTLLMSDRDTFDWRTYLTLGTHSIAQIDPESISPELTWCTFEFIDKMLQENMRFIKAHRYQVSNTIGKDSLIGKRVRKVSALLILEAQLVTKANMGEKKIILSKRILEFVEMFSLKETSSDHMAYFSFAGILAHQGLEMTIESAQRILLLNQTLASSISVLENENDKRSYLFEIRVIVFRAVRWIMEYGKIETIKGCILGEISETQTFTAVSPFVEIGGTRHVNLLSGDTYINGSRLVGVQVSELEALFNSCKYDPGSLKFSFSRTQIKGNQKMVILDVNPLTAKVLKRPDGKILALTRIKIHMSGWNTLLEEYDDGSQYLYFTITKKSWQGYSVPATDDSEKYYSIYRVLEKERRSLFLFQHKGSSIWFSKDNTFYFDETLKNLIPALLSDNSTEALANPLARSSTMAVFESADRFFALFKYYSDHSGRPLWIQQDRQTLKWKMHYDSKYQVSENQTFVKSEYLQNFLVVETSDGSVRKVVLPIEHYQFEKKKKQKNYDGDEYVDFDYLQSSGSSGSNKMKQSYKLEFSRKNLNVLKSTVLMTMTSDGHLKPASRFEHLLLAYKYLVGREYLDSFNHMLKVHQIEPFSPSELRIIGWITVSFTAMHDGSPESVAIRAYTAYLLFANDRLFGVLNEPPALKDDDNRTKKAPGPYDPDAKWIEFWENSIVREPCFQVADSYFDVRSNIPVALRFDCKSGRNLVAPFEQLSWLKTLYENRSKKTRSNIAMQIYPNQERETLNSPDKIEQITPTTVTVNSYNYKDAFADQELTYNISSFHPENFESRVYKLFNHFMFGKYSNYEAEEYRDHLTSLKHSKFAVLAGMLVSALDQRKSRDLPYGCKALKKKCSVTPTLGFWEHESWKSQCISYYQDCFNSSTTKYQFVPTEIKNFSFQMPKIPDENIALKVKPESPLKTIVVEPKAIGDYANLNELKDALLNEQLTNDDAIVVLSLDISLRTEYLKIIMGEIQSAIDLAWGKGSKTPLEVEIRRIAKGTRSIEEQDVLHLYAKASKRNYYQYYPDVPDGAYQAIHDLCTNYAANLAELNDIKRLAKAIQNMGKDEGAWLLEVKKRRCRSRSTDNVILAYEIFINSRLTKRQYTDIKELVTKAGQKYVDKVIQRMMSAGKTFILGTILSNLKADSENLSVLVVPRSLYSSEASSLISRTFNAFGTAGFSFRVSRESSEKITQRLEWISEAMEAARQQGKYMIVAPELLLTLQNRFTEIVLHESEKEQAKEEFVYLQKILKILHDHGAATFDEIDMIFNPTQELNFPLNSTRHDNDDDDKYIGTMLSELYYTLLDKDIVQIADIRKNVVIQMDDYGKIRLLLIAKMVEKLHNQRFVMPSRKKDNEKPLVMLNPEGLHDKLSEFFNVLPSNPDQEKPFDRHAGVILDELSSDELTRSILSVLRLAINEWVLASWSGNVNENYGVSSKTHYAIPYASAGVAKDGSEFSFRWLTYVRTERMYLVLGLDRARLADAIQWLQEWAMEEIEQNVGMEYSIAVKLSKELFGKDPSAIDIRSIEEIDLHLTNLKIKQDTEAYLIFILLWIGQKVIPGVRFYENQISANAQDFTMIFNSIQGYTGTIGSVKILPPVFHPKGAIQLQQKIEDRIEGKVRADKVHEIIPMPNGFEVLCVPVGLSAGKLWNLDSIKTSIESMEQAGHPLNAIIDVGAYFKDETNETVAESMLSLKPSVLYFSTKANKLAVKTSNDKEKMVETISRASLEEFGIDDKDRITLYDQQHCTGVDVFHHERGFALVIIGLKTSARDFNQAVMRMRKYLQGQRIVIIVPDNVSGIISSGNTGISVENVLEFLHKNMRENVKMQNSLAMGHILRTLCKKPVYELFLSDSLENSSHCNAYDIWVKGTDIPLEDQILPLESQDFVEYMKNRILVHEESIYQCLGTNGTDGILAEAHRILQDATEDSPNDYPKEVIVSAVEDNDQMIQNEVESSRQMDLENENEMETEAAISPLRGDSKPLDFSKKYFPKATDFSTAEPSLMELRALFEDVLRLDMFKYFITTRIYASTAFLKHIFGKNRSYVFYILWLEREGEAPLAAIINSYEAQTVKPRLLEGKDVFGFKAWLLTPSGIQCQLRNTAPTIDKPTIAEVLIFGGLTKILESPEWIPYFEEWLGRGNSKETKSVLYRNFVLDDVEGRAALKGPLGKLLQVYEPREKGLLDHPSYQALNVFSNKTQRTKKYLADLINTDSPRAFAYAIKFTGFSASLAPETFKPQIKACLRKGFDMLIINLMKAESPDDLENWGNFSKLQPYMDSDDYIYLLIKSQEIEHFDDCENKPLFQILSTFLYSIETNIKRYTPSLSSMVKNMKYYLLNPADSYEMAMAGC